MHYNRPGITIVEVIVAIALAALIILSLIPSVLNIAGGFTRQSIEARNVQSVGTALSTIKSDADRNYAFLGAPFSPDTAAPAPSGDWTFIGNGAQDRTLMMLLPATDKPYQDPSRSLVYNSDTTDCNTFDGNPVVYTTIYYVHSENLYKRTVLDPEQPGCINTHQSTSCLTGCDIKDILLETNVSIFEIEYHEDQSSVDGIDYDTLSNSGLDNVTSATVKLGVSRSGPGDTQVTYSDTIRINVHPMIQS